jgi:hypothetical protein
MDERVKRCGACRRMLLNDRRDYCDVDCKRDAAYARERLAKGTKTVRKRRLRTPIAEGVRNGGFSSRKSVASKPPSTPDFGAIVREQIEVQRDKPSPVSFTSPDATKCRVWLASDREGNRIIGDVAGGASTSRTLSSRASSGDQSPPPGSRAPKHYEGRSLSLGAMTQFKL